MLSILLVEDSRFLRLVTERTLITAGFAVLTSCNGEEGLRVAIDQVPDLIVLDMLLPKLSGQDVLQRLKANPTTSHIPVIVLSGLSQANEDKLIQDGAAAYLEKSSLLTDGAPHSLVRTIGRILEERPNIAKPVAGSASD